MAEDINVVVLNGRLTRDPETKFLPSGTALCEFSIASNSRVKRGDQWEDKGSFFDCTAFGFTAEFVGKYLTKGSAVTVFGRLTQDSWEDKTTGAKRSKVKIIAEKVQGQGGKGSGGQSRDEQRQSESGEGSQETPEQPLKDPFVSGGGGPPASEEVPFAASF